jgi:hypothetical protein
MCDYVLMKVKKIQSSNHNNTNLFVLFVIFFSFSHDDFDIIVAWIHLHLWFLWDFG